MIGYIKDRVVATAVSATIEVLRQKGHTVRGSVTIRSESLLPLLDDLPSQARESLERYVGDGLRVSLLGRAFR